MLDFLIVLVDITKKRNGESITIKPDFSVIKSKDLMIRGGDFYAIWDEERGIWSRDEQDAVRLIDNNLRAWIREHDYPETSNIAWMIRSSSGSIDRFHKYCQKQMRDNFVSLDENIKFANDSIKKEDYASKRLTYPLVKGSYESWDKLVGTLYSPEERHKIEWAIGSIVNGDSKTLQKFMVLYGSHGTGKSTILKIIKKLFGPYCATFDAKSLGSNSASFALEAFVSNPLVAIQQDGNLSKIEDNTRLNSLVSHEDILVNSKFKSVYSDNFKAFLFMGSNNPVKITDAKSGLLRRLIDVRPSGKKVPKGEYNRLIKQIDYELGAIAYHCKEIYEDDPSYYDTYTPMEMMGATNDFYNFMLDSYRVFKKNNGTGVNAAWEMYKVYCEDAHVPYPVSKRLFSEELREYFESYHNDFREDGKEREYYDGFKTYLFETNEERKSSKKNETSLQKKLDLFKESFHSGSSIFEDNFADCPAQYPAEDGSGRLERKWINCKTKLKDLDTSKVHHVKLPESVVFVDFDKTDETGKKSFDVNARAVIESGLPETYAEKSKSGGGVHLVYYYDGDTSKLSRVFSENIEVKIQTGDGSMRRVNSDHNDLPIAHIGSGLPLKEEKVINKDILVTEKGLRTTIRQCLNKEHHGHTTPEVQFIYKILNEAYESGIEFDVSDMYNAITCFAAQSTNGYDKCMDLVDKMHFKSESLSENVNDDEKTILFYDVEVYPNLFLICFMPDSDDVRPLRIFNPKPSDIETLLDHKLIGFNNRSYDNHMIYACMLGYSNEDLYNLSQKIINSKKGDNSAKFSEAFNLSFTDVYDFASAGNKKSLKKFEIEMGIHHQEMGLPWDQPVPENMWDLVGDYCCNDVIATRAVFHYLKGDWFARQLLADITGMTENDTTNSLSTRWIFEGNRHPQNEFNWRDMSKPVPYTEYDEYVRKFGDDYDFRVFNAEGLPEYRSYIPGEVLPDGWSILPFFDGYTYSYGKSVYLGEEVGEGGKVYAEPGMYSNVLDLDISGQHPSTINAERVLGPKYTARYMQIVQARVHIKHGELDVVEDWFGGKLKKYIQMIRDGALTTKELANAFKTVVNSVYGLTKTAYENPFRDWRNVDNIVAKRGSLFMTLLKREVQKRGFQVAHIKTDSIKIPNATPEIKKFIEDFGKEYGYYFDVEAEFDKFCLVNGSTYVAKFKEPEIDKEGNEHWWTATASQFKEPYVFKTLFSKEKIMFEDYCQTFSVKNALYLDMNETLPDVTAQEKALEKLEKQYKEGKISDTTFESEGRRLTEEIEIGHDYHFVGKVGQFCPVKSNCGGGVLLAGDGTKFNSAQGAKGYRWLESELVRGSDSTDDIDVSYYTKLVDQAVEDISKYGDFEWFVSDDNMYEFMNVPEGPDGELPWDENGPVSA